MKRAGLAIAVLTLMCGPWLALPQKTFVLSASTAAAAGETYGDIAPYAHFARGAPSPIVQAFAAAPAATGCTCREITVNARNVVRDADVRTGDAEVVNRSITYVAPSYSGDDEIDIDQEAEAHTGDAVAGQILGVSGGDGCSRVEVNATNIVEDSDVRSGDATARNESVVLIAPAANRGDLDIDVDQEADAVTGDVIAGQIIGVTGGGGACGDVMLRAINRVHDVDLRSGEALAENLSRFIECGTPACLEEIRELLADVDTVQVCDGADDECRDVPTDEFVEMLEKDFEDPDRPRPDRDEDDDDEEEEDDERGHRPRREEPASSTATQFDEMRDAYMDEYGEYLPD